MLAGYLRLAQLPETLLPWWERHLDVILATIVGTIVGGLVVVVATRVLDAVPSLARRFFRSARTQGVRLWHGARSRAAKTRDLLWDYPNPQCESRPRLGGMAEKWARRAANDWRILRQPCSDSGSTGRFSNLIHHEALGPGIKLIWPDGSGATVYSPGSFVIQIDYPSVDMALAWSTDQSRPLPFADTPLADWTARSIAQTLEDWTDKADALAARLGIYRCEVSLLIRRQGNTSTYRHAFTVEAPRSD